MPPKIAVYDIEANGLELNNVSLVHCICCLPCDGDGISVKSFYDDLLKDGLDYLDSFDWIVAHNQIWYDLKVLNKIFGWTPKAKIIDTLLLSRLLNPDRPRPLGMTGKAGPHSLEAWAYRFGGEQKVQNEDWSVFTNNMLLRCESDVRINYRVYQELLNEAQ